MNVLGMHTYMGGFMYGLQYIGFESLGSVETWGKPAALAEYLGVKQLQVDDIPSINKPVDLLVGNPPCSRFSAMTHNKFDNTARTVLDNFGDLKAILTLGKVVKASVVWWENGPIAFTGGRDLIKQAHDYLGAAYTLVLKFSMPLTGAPQQRTRTHVFHVVHTDVDKNGEEAESRLTIPMSSYAPGPVYDWVTCGIPESRLQPYSCEQYFPLDNPKATIDAAWGEREKMGFLSTKPILINEHQRYVPSVIAYRHMAWEEHNRWFSIPEYANIMTYPPDVNWTMKFHLQGFEVMRFMAKSVAPAVSAWLALRFMPQLLNRVGSVNSQPLSSTPHERIGDIIYVRMLSTGKSKDVIE